MLRRAHFLALFVVLSVCLFSLVLLHPRVGELTLPLKWKPAPQVARLDSELSPEPCEGPRGVLLSESSIDQPEHLRLADVSYPAQTFGSFRELGLEQTWTSADQRYGPYGFSRRKSLSSNASSVEQPKVDWGRLQNACLLRNRERFGQPHRFHTQSRFRLQNPDDRRRLDERVRDAPKPPRVSNVRDPTSKTGRTAIVLRTWSTYEYTEEDLYNLRSIIVETNLATSGNYAVFLLVDVKDLNKRIHDDPVAYEEVLRESVPKEFRKMAVLFDQTLLESWYPSVGEHRPFYQIMQPFQLFAQFYPEFDHYWQVEMDTRFLGHTGKTLDAISTFAKAQPRKQAIERSTWTYMESIHGPYSQFTKAVNKSLDGNTPYWGATKIPEIHPIGPDPPTSAPEDEDFTWGVDEDADLIVLNAMQSTLKRKDWFFKDWQFGFSQPSDELPQFFSTPAQARASWNLLNAIHHAQSVQGLATHGEATLPSFALWHGLKAITVPIPQFIEPVRNSSEMDYIFNGVAPQDSVDGMADGPSRSFMRPWDPLIGGSSFNWASALPDRILNAWLANGGALREEEDPVSVLTAYNGTVYAPNIMVHPRKTNTYMSEAGSRR